LRFIHTHQRQIVAGRRKLDFGKPGNADDEQGTVASTGAVEQLAKVPEALIGAVGPDDFEHFLHLEGDDGRILLAVSVVLDEDLLCLVGSVVGDPPRNLSAYAPDLTREVL
jgi:hypothetical protein